MRKHERQQVSRPARIEIPDGEALQCRIGNISPGGALLLLQEVDELPNVFHLLDLTSDVRRKVRKVWTGPNRAGVEYIDGETAAFARPRIQQTFGKRIKQE